MSELSTYYVPSPSHESAHLILKKKKKKKSCKGQAIVILIFKLEGKEGGELAWNHTANKARSPGLGQCEV